MTVDLAKWGFFVQRAQGRPAIDGSLASFLLRFIARSVATTHSILVDMGFIFDCDYPSTNNSSSADSCIS